MKGHSGWPTLPDADSNKRDDNEPEKYTTIAQAAEILGCATGRTRFNRFLATTSGDNCSLGGTAGFKMRW